MWFGREGEEESPHGGWFGWKLSDPHREMGLLLPGEPRRGGGGGRQVSQRSRRHPRSPRPTLLLVLLVLASAAAVSASAALHYRSDYGVGGGYRSGVSEEGKGNKLIRVVPSTVVVVLHLSFIG